MFRGFLRKKREYILALSRLNDFALKVAVHAPGA